MRLLPAVLAMAALAAPAQAIDLTGTWEEVRHQTCTGLTSDGEKIALKNSQTGFGDISITQTGNELFLEVHGFFWFFEGFVHQETNGTRGQGILQKCPGGIPVPDPYITYRITKAQTFTPNSKGVSGKMTTLYVFGNSAETYSCSINWERTSTANPETGPCP